MDPLEPEEESVYWRWVAIRSHLEAALGKQSGLPAPLSAYAIDHEDDPTLEHLGWLREEYGTPDEPSAEELMRLLKAVDDERE